MRFFETQNSICRKGILVGLGRQPMTSEELVDYCKERELGSRKLVFDLKKELGKQGLIEPNTEFEEGLTKTRFQLTEKGVSEVTKIWAIEYIVEFKIDPREENHSIRLLASPLKEFPRFYGYVIQLGYELQNKYAPLVVYNEEPMISESLVHFIPNLIALSMDWALAGKPFPDPKSKDPKEFLSKSIKILESWQQMFQKQLEEIEAKERVAVS